MHLPPTEPRGHTLVHRASPRLKLGTALGLILAIALLPRRPDVLYWAPTAVTFVLWAVSRMPVAYIWRRLLIVEFLILGIALLSLLSPASRPVVASAIIKSNLSVMTILLLTWTTPFHEILQELRRLKLPGIMLTTLALMYRYLPVLVGETRRMQRARACRTFSDNRRAAWRELAVIIGQLFVRSAERAERIYLAMCARGWK